MLTHYHIPSPPPPPPLVRWSDNCFALGCQMHTRPFCSEWEGVALWAMGTRFLLNDCSWCIECWINSCQSLWGEYNYCILYFLFTCPLLKLKKCVFFRWNRIWSLIEGTKITGTHHTKIEDSTQRNWPKANMWVVLTLAPLSFWSLRHLTTSSLSSNLVTE